ncbi:MAG: hypothetical protein ACRCYU_04455 [Nocardioides sp.]
MFDKPVRPARALPGRRVQGRRRTTPSTEHAPRADGQPASGHQAEHEARLDQASGEPASTDQAAIDNQRLGAGEVGAAEIRSWLLVLRQLDRSVSNRERIDQIRALEELKMAARAAQTRITADYERTHQMDP